MKKGSLTHLAASSRESKKTSLGHAHVGVGSDAWDSLISLCSTVPSGKWISIQGFSPTFSPYFPPFFYLFSQVACLPFFLPLPVSSTAKKPACLRMALAGNSVGILQLPEHRHKTWTYKVLPGFVLHAHDCCLPPHWAELTRELEDALFFPLSSCVCRE